MWLPFTIKRIPSEQSFGKLRPGHRTESRETSLCPSLCPAGEFTPFLPGLSGYFGGSVLLCSIGLIFHAVGLLQAGELSA